MAWPHTFPTTTTTATCTCLLHHNYGLHGHTMGLRVHIVCVHFHSNLTIFLTCVCKVKQKQACVAEDACGRTEAASKATTLTVKAFLPTIMHTRVNNFYGKLSPTCSQRQQCGSRLGSGIREGEAPGTVPHHERDHNSIPMWEEEETLTYQIITAVFRTIECASLTCLRGL